MSCSIVQNPHTLPNPQTIQKPQNSHYSNYAIGFAAGTIATGALIGSALAINSFMKETPSLFSNLVNATRAPAVGGLRGAIISTPIGLLIAHQKNLQSMQILNVRWPIGIVSAAAGAATGAVVSMASRLFPI